MQYQNLIHAIHTLFEREATGIKLVPKIKANRSNLDSQMRAIPEVIELLVVDPDNNEIAADCSGFVLNHGMPPRDLFLQEVQNCNLILSSQRISQVIYLRISLSTAYLV